MLPFAPSCDFTVIRISRLSYEINHKAFGWKKTEGCEMKGTGSREPPLAVYSRDSSESPNVWCALASTQVLRFRFFSGEKGVFFLKEGFAVYIQPEIWSLPRGASRRIVGGWKWISMAPLTWIAVHERMKILFPRNIFL